MSAVSDKIQLSVAWQGPTTLHSRWSGDVQVKVIELLFNQAVDRVLAHIPEKTSSDSDRFTQLLIACRQERGRLLIREIRQDTLQIRVEQLRSLSFRAHLTVNPQIPKELKAGEKYCLQITSDGSSMKAELVKEKATASLESE